VAVLSRAKRAGKKNTDWNPEIGSAFAQKPGMSLHRTAVGTGAPAPKLKVVSGHTCGVAATAIGPAIADQADGCQHILIVDDEAQIRELLTAYLQKQGYRVSAASTSEEALHALKQTPVDLAVLDISLENEDGLKLLSQIKIGYPGVRVVMLTGLGFVEDLLEEAQRKGADGYMSKVLSLDELHMAIQRALRPLHQPASAA